jgi:hypothetical protein
MRVPQGRTEAGIGRGDVRDSGERCQYTLVFHRIACGPVRQVVDWYQTFTGSVHIMALPRATDAIERLGTMRLESVAKITVA